jgi:hypothetical protein
MLTEHERFSQKHEISQKKIQKNSKERFQVSDFSFLSPYLCRTAHYCRFFLPLIFYGHPRELYYIYLVDSNGKLCYGLAALCLSVIEAVLYIFAAGR